MRILFLISLSAIFTKIINATVVSLTTPSYSPELYSNNELPAYALDNALLTCSSGNVLQSFQLYDNNGFQPFYYDYSCLLSDIDGNNYQQSTVLTTPSALSDNINYLSSQNINCGTGSFINSYQMKLSGTNWYYTITCVSFGASAISTCNTVTNPSTSIFSNSYGVANLVYLDRQTVQCESNQGLQQFQFEASGTTGWYTYTCCSLIATTSVPTASPTMLPTTSVPTASPTMLPTTSIPTASPTRLPTASSSLSLNVISFTTPSYSPEQNPGYQLEASDLYDALLICSSGNVLQSFQLYDNNGVQPYYYDYSCLLSNRNNYQQSTVLTTPSASEINIYYLSSQNINCGTGSFINSYQMKLNGTNWYYNITCVSFGASAISTCNTVTNPSTSILSNSNGIANLVYLDRQTVQCKSNQGLQQFQFEASGTTGWYTYTCCSLVESTFDPTSSPTTYPSSQYPVATPTVQLTNYPTSYSPSVSLSVIPSTSSPTSFPTLFPTASPSQVTLFWNTTGPNEAWSGIAISSNGKYQTGVVLAGYIFSSNNNGSNWNQVAWISNWCGVAMSSNGQTQIAIAKYAPIAISIDYGNDWEATSSLSLNWTSVASSSNSQYITSTVFGGYIYSSSDYGITWISTATIKNWVSITISSSGQYQTAAENTGNSIYTSNDFGQTWTQGDEIQNWKMIVMSSDGEYQTAIVNGYGFIYVSNDFGQNWSTQTPEDQWYSITMSSNGQFIYANDYQGIIYYSNNYGQGFYETATSNSNSASGNNNDNSNNNNNNNDNNNSHVVGIIVTAGTIIVGSAVTTAIFVISVAIIIASVASGNNNPNPTDRPVQPPVRPASNPVIINIPTAPTTPIAPTSPVSSPVILPIPIPVSSQPSDSPTLSPSSQSSDSPVAETTLSPSSQSSDSPVAETTLSPSSQSSDSSPPRLMPAQVIRIKKMMFRYLT